jgi:hypothetical protein
MRCDSVIGLRRLVTEHNLEVIKTADWIVDFGTEGSDADGRGHARVDGGRAHKGERLLRPKPSVPQGWRPTGLKSWLREVARMDGAGT